MSTVNPDQLSDLQTRIEDFERALQRLENRDDAFTRAFESALANLKAERDALTAAPSENE